MKGYEDKISIGNVEYTVWHTVEKRMINRVLHMSISKVDEVERKLVYVIDPLPITFSGVRDWQKIKREIIAGGNIVGDVQPLQEVGSLEQGELEKVLDAFGKSRGFE